MKPSRPAAASAPNGPRLQHRPFSDPSRLAPEDAFSHSPPKKQSELGAPNGQLSNGVLHELTRKSQRRPEKERGRSGSRRRRQEWKKLLWVPQIGYPDNYTDPATFLSHLQRNPRLLPYDFWPLVSDFTVVVQHICSVAIFICSFIVIYQERISPVTVASWGSAGTVLGWVLWDFWVGQQETLRMKEEAMRLAIAQQASSAQAEEHKEASDPSTYLAKDVGLGLTLQTSNIPKTSQSHSRNQSITSIPSATSPVSPIRLSDPTIPISRPSPYQEAFLAPHFSDFMLSARMQARLSTIKSAILIYCALLGLSPILKSLTKSTSKDSIWALSTWLMLINIFFFDYGGGVGVKFPASLSTNAALMASTVLASRLSSSTHVFSLTLFSIEVFGLFPGFRRHLRHVSWKGHVLLTVALILGSGAFMGFTLAPESRWWKAAIGGAVLWGLVTALGMGGCSWWLIGLQRYKNVVIGPWDPARPVIRGGWE